MKKAKKLLSLFLAALMLMSCFGAISASAMTMDAAETAAADFNATIPDHSAVYANKSAKQWNNTKTSLDTTLGLVLKAVNIKKTIYSENTVKTLQGLDATLYDLVAGLADSNPLIKYALRTLTPSAMADAMDKASVYPEIASYLRTIDTYSDIDMDQIDWGVVPGDRDSFVKAANWALFPVNVAFSLLLPLLTLPVSVYDNALVPLLESFHQGTMPIESEFRAATTNKNGVAIILNIVCDAIDDLEVAPLSYLCEILPDLTNSLAIALDTLKNNKLIASMGIELPSGLSDIINLVVPMLPSILGLGEDYVMPALNLPEIDEHYLITMGTAYAAESGMKDGARMAIKGNSTMVFAAGAQYVQEVLQDKGNQAAIGDLVVAKAGPEYLESYRNVVAAAQNGTPIDVADACLSLIEEIATNTGAQEDVNPIVAFFAKIAAFFSNLAKKILALFK